jgi:uncharacterized protein (DUF983 family)
MMPYLDHGAGARDVEKRQTAAPIVRSDNRPTRRTAYLRALRIRCPKCGGGKLLQAYLKPVANCSVCGERYGHIRSDDAAPWLTILVVGHILVPIMVAIESADRFPQGFSMAFWPIAAVALTALVLPRAKALMMAIIWFEKAPGSEISN